MYRHQGRKQIKPITRYCSYDFSGYYITMTEVTLYEHSVSYLRVYVYFDEFTLVKAKRINMETFREYERDPEFNLFD